MKKEEKNTVILTEIYKLIKHFSDKRTKFYNLRDFMSANKCEQYIAELLVESRKFS